MAGLSAFLPLNGPVQKMNEFIEAISISVITKDGTIHTGQSIGDIKRTDMTAAWYTLEDGSKVNAMVRETEIEGHAV